VADVTLVFAPVVVSEVDEHENGPGREKARAKSVIKVLSLGLSSPPSACGRASRRWRWDEEPPDALLARHRLQVRSNDDRLLALFLKFRDEHPQARVLFLSADGGLSTKARSCRIELVVPDHMLACRGEPDDTERELEKTRRALAEAKSAMPDLCLPFGEGNKHHQFALRLVRAFDDQPMRPTSPR
jgi:PIN domain